MKIKMKFILLPTIAASISILVVFFTLFSIDSKIFTHMHSSHPKLSATYEMEININEAAAEIYLDGINHEKYSNAKVIFDDAINDYKYYFNIFKSSGALDDEVEKLEKLHSNFITKGDRIFYLHDKQYREIIERRNILNNSIEIHLDDNLQVNIDMSNPKELQKRHVIDEIEINMHELISAVRGYILNNNAFLKERIRDSMEDLGIWLTKYKTYSLDENEKTTIARIEKDIEQIKRLSLSIIALEDEIQKLTEEFEKLHIALDYIMDEIIQVKTMNEIENEAKSINDNLQRFFSIIVIIAIVLMMLSYVIFKPIVKTLHSLVKSTELFTEKKEITFLKHKNDELGILGKTLQNMMIKLQDEERKRDETMTELNAANKKLKVLAHTDALTGINNRGYFLNIAQKYLDIAKRNSSSLGVLSLDLDNFKSVNDTYGHQAGDDVLKSFANNVNSLLRSSDLFGRIGGEEFCIVLQNTSKDGVKIFAQRICKSIEIMDVQTNNERLNVTVSIGVAILNNEEKIDDLIKKSDDALYKAKENGRNQVVMS